MKIKYTTFRSQCELHQVHKCDKTHIVSETLCFFVSTLMVFYACCLILLNGYLITRAPGRTASLDVVGCLEYTSPRESSFHVAEYSRQRENSLHVGDVWVIAETLGIVRVMGTWILEPLKGQPPCGWMGILIQEAQEKRLNVGDGPPEYRSPKEKSHHLGDGVTEYRSPWQGGE